MLLKNTWSISHPDLVDSSFRDSRDSFMIAAYFGGFSPSFSVLLQEQFFPLCLDTLELGSITKFKNSGLLICLGVFFLEMS